MMNKDITEWGKYVSGDVPKNAFTSETLNKIDGLGSNDIRDFIQLYILESIPRFIIDRPFIYNAVRRHIVKNIGLTDNDYNVVYLTGSAQLGFSLHPTKERKSFNPKTSDLDFFIVSPKLFGELKTVFEQWGKEPEKKDKQSERAYETSKKNLQSGFFQILQLSPRYKHVIKYLKMEETTLNFINYLLKESLTEPFSIKKISFRVYKNYDAAINQIKLNIEYFIKCAR
ncbi:hypothetical protein A9G13_09990 [Gilliamella sp. wkB178]|uniref:hypothetical protein n=1 Tax=Gilliamella sp. wkB178 TaxID=3120259 RepID=UPI00080E0E74|nr:hypothetical protein [Gilliamella apicola]OCG06588.1 hypothetical protein A9G13_09990 [Gilliamella apicola]